MPLIHFLLVYDLDRQALVGDPQEFSSPSEAAVAYAELEQQHRHDSNLEIVLIGADSLDTIRSTHGNYFDGKRKAAGSRFFEAVG
jgi:hypothetical protein